MFCSRYKKLPKNVDIEKISKVQTEIQRKRKINPF